MTEYRVGCAIVRIHGTPDHDRIKAASEQFMKRVLAARKKAEGGKNMTIREKLALHDEAEKRNNERIHAYLKTVGAHGAVEIHARAILGSLDILAQHYGVKREALLDLLVSTLWAMQQSDEQEG